jgi:hypothetical protein
MIIIIEECREMQIAETDVTLQEKVKNKFYSHVIYPLFVNKIILVSKSDCPLRMSELSSQCVSNKVCMHR